MLLPSAKNHHSKSSGLTTNTAAASRRTALRIRSIVAAVVVLLCLHLIISYESVANIKPTTSTTNSSSTKEPQQTQQPPLQSSSSSSAGGPLVSFEAENTRLLIADVAWAGMVSNVTSDMAVLDHCHLAAISPKKFADFRAALVQYYRDRHGLTVPPPPPLQVQQEKENAASGDAEQVVELSQSQQQQQQDFLDELTLQGLELYARAVNACDFRLYGQGASSRMGINNSELKRMLTLVQNLPPSPLDEARLVYVISAHTDAVQLRALVDAIWLPQHLIVIHLERRVDNPEFAAEVKELAETYKRNLLVLQFGSVTYASGSLSHVVLTILQFVEKELMTNIDYDYLVTMSASSYPLWAAQELARHLKEDERRVRLGRLDYRGARGLCYRRANAVGLVLSRDSSNQKRLLELRDLTKFLQQYNASGTLPPGKAFLPPQLELCRHKTVTGNSAAFDRPAIQALLQSPDALNFLARLKLGGMINEESSWAGALAIIGREQDIMKSGMMWQAWPCYNNMGNSMFRYDPEDKICVHIFDDGGTGRKHRKVHGMQGLQTELMEARERGHLFARKFDSSDTYFLDWIRTTLHNSESGGPQQEQQQEIVIAESSSATISSVAALSSAVNDAPKAKDVTASSPPMSNEIQVKIPYPVFVASLYKSGTTTIHEYFKCGGQKSVHYSGGANRRTGPCLQKRIQNGLFPVFEGCGGDNYDIYTDNAYLHPPHSCFDPSVHGLDAIYQSYPNGTILMAVRDRTSWFDSVDRYRFKNWALLSILKSCPDLWPTQRQDMRNRTTLTDEDILHFYDWHTEHVRNFAKQHPSMTYIEVTLESNQTASILEEKIGIPASCWGRKNFNNRIQSTTTGV